MKTRFTDTKTCPSCNKSFVIGSSNKNQRACSRTCSNKLWPRRSPRAKHVCIICNAVFLAKFKSPNLVCSLACNAIHQRQLTLERFHNGLISNRETIKNVIIREYGHKCSMCNNTEWLSRKIALEVDHIDGNAGNNQPSNLRLLCPNCHSTTPTWKGANRGSGRKSIGLPIF